MTDRKPPIVTGQRAQVLNLIREKQPVMSLHISINNAIPEAAARISELREMGFNIITTIAKEVEFRGRIRRNVAFYSLGAPEWPVVGFFAGEL